MHCLDHFLSVCFVRPRRPPRPPLFPYTTLFRSGNDTRFVVLNKIDTMWDTLSTLEHIEQQIERQRDGAADRKSTRLNSSHRCISYAVFCLKKKNRKRLTEVRRMPGQAARHPNRY